MQTSQQLVIGVGYGLFGSGVAGVIFDRFFGQEQQNKTLASGFMLISGTALVIADCYIRIHK